MMLELLSDPDFELADLATDREDGADEGHGHGDAPFCFRPDDARGSILEPAAQFLGTRSA